MPAGAQLSLPTNPVVPDGESRARRRLRTELILAIGVVLEVVLVFGLGLPEGAGLADLGHDLAGPEP
jgi:hypothetical protein